MTLIVEHNRGVSVGGELGDLLLSPLVQPHLTSTPSTEMDITYVIIPLF